MAALDALRKEGLRIVMLTGDNRTTAQAVAAKLGITEVEADVLPDQKNAIVRRLKSEGRVVAMAGDGVNDAPALAEADVGIAMGTGTDVAMQSAGLTLVKGDLAGIARGRALSRATMRNIRENLVLAFVYNVIGIPVAAGVLYPAFGILLSPIIAAAAMSLSSVSVIGNALRLRITEYNMRVARVVFAVAAYVAVMFIALEYAGAAVGLPWAPPSWAFPVVGILLVAGGLLLLVPRIFHGARKRTHSSVDDSKGIQA
jgi:cation transport ATPase